jgi:hypothetical protein
MCSSCQREDALRQANDLLEDPDFNFAEESIDGIKTWIEENSHVTDPQRRALNNIAGASRY